MNFLHTIQPTSNTKEDMVMFPTLLAFLDPLGKAWKYYSLRHREAFYFLNKVFSNSDQDIRIKA